MERYKITLIYFGKVKNIMIRTSDNKELVEEIKAKLKENGGFCPCRLERTPDTKCMCKEFREQESGECHCGLFIKE